MAIAEEITRLQNSLQALQTQKTALKSALESKGVSVSDGATLEEMIALVGNIEVSTTSLIEDDDAL